jgi:hypothetical protein
MKTQAHDLLVEAELAAFDLPDDRFNELQRQLQDPVYLEDVEQELELQNAVQNFPLSEAVRKECEKEMRLAALRNWSTR